jgi:short-subunit dehydrogenase
MTAVSPALQPPKGAIVIGASSGIGAALARLLAREGYSVALVGRRAEALEALCAELNAGAGPGPVRARPYVHDVTRYADVPAAFQTILRDLGRVNVVVYSAGVLMPVAQSEFNFEKDRAALETNLLGAVAWLNQAAMFFERMGSGHLVGISSIAGERGRVGNPAYNASKAGLNTYLEALRNRLTRKGVHVLTVKPGFVDTPMLRQAGVKAFWVVSPETVAEQTWRAIQRRRQGFFVAGQWQLVALALHHIPSVIFRRMKF